MPNYLRIGALSSLTGVSPDTLRAWERRYGLFSPARTTGGFRLYSDDDLARVQEMARLVDAGVAASEAARRVLAQGAPALITSSNEPPVAGAARALHAALRSFDEAALENAIDRVLATADLDTAIRDVFIPALIEVGVDWAAGTLSVAQEHFGVGILRGRLMGLARGWDMGLGPRALLACPPDEDHDISLAMFGLALRRRGWRITFLGANTPFADLIGTQRRLGPQLTVLFSPDWERHRALVPALSEAASSSPLALAGATAGRVAEDTGCRWLGGDPVSAADEVTHGLTRAPRGVSVASPGMQSEASP